MTELHDPAFPGETPAAPPPVARTAPEGVLKGEQGMGTALVAISAFLVVVAAFAAFSNTFSVPFQGLDLEIIREDAAVHRVVTAPQAFARLAGAPLTMFSYALNWGLTPDHPAEFHFFNLLLHAINGVLIYLLGRRLVSPRLPEPVCMLAGILFAVHPLASESVYYLVGRPVLLGAAFGLASLLGFLLATDRPKVSPAILAASVICYALAVASCFPLLFLPLVLPALDACTNGEGAVRRHRWWHTLYCLVLIALAVAIGASWGDAPFPPEAHAGALAVFSQLSVRFFALVLTPIHLSPVWQGLDDLTVNWIGVGLFLILCSAALAAALLRKAAGAALLLSCVFLAGVALLFPAEHAYSERGLYLPLAGMALVLPWLFSLGTTPIAQRIGVGIVSVLILGAIWLTFVRGLEWQDPVGLWNAAADQAPDSSEPARYVARYLTASAAAAGTPDRQQELLASTAEYWQRVLDVAPSDAEALAGLGMTLFTQGKPADAVPLLKRALHENPFDKQASLYLALALDIPAEQGDRFASVRESLQYYQRASAEAPLPPELQARHGVARLAVGDLGGAIALLEAPAKAQPESPAATTFSQLVRAAQRVQQLEGEAQQRLMQDPRDVEAAVLRAEAMLIRGNWMSAFYILDRAMHRGQDLAAAWTLMGAVRARAGSAGAFLQEWGSLHLDQPDLWRQLAWRTAGFGVWDAALAYLEHFAAANPQAKPPTLTLAEIALELKQPQVAQDYLVRAAEKAPQDPAPWLALSDIAAASKNLPEVQRLLGEAQRRGAPEEEIKKRAEAAGVTPGAAPAPQRTVIR